MKKVFQFFTLIVIITLTSCTAKPHESLLIYKSKDKDFITIQRMSSGKRDTIFLNNQKEFNKALDKYHLESDAKQDIESMWGEQTNRYIKGDKYYHLDNNYTLISNGMIWTLSVIGAIAILVIFIEGIFKD